MITAATVALDVVVHHGTGGDGWGHSAATAEKAIRLRITVGRLGPCFSGWGWWASSSCSTPWARRCRTTARCSTSISCTMPCLRLHSRRPACWRCTLPAPCPFGTAAAHAALPRLARADAPRLVVEEPVQHRPPPLAADSSRKAGRTCGRRPDPEESASQRLAPSGDPASSLLCCMYLLFIT